MDLIVRYIEQVVRHLPHSQRQDITQELEGLIHDMLSRRCGDRDPSIDDIEAVLLDLGNPKKLADNYRGIGRSLIGPAFYDLYTLVLRIVLIAAGGGVLIATAIELATSPPDGAWPALVMVIGRIYSVLISVFGFVTLVFAINDRYNEKGRQAMTDNPIPWHPNQLPPKTVKALMIKRGDPIVAIVFTVLFMIVINFSMSLVGAHFKEDGIWQFIPLFSEQLLVYLPWINASLAVALLVEAVKLMTGRWTLPVVAASLLQKVFGLIIGLQVFTDSRIFSMGFFSEFNRAILGNESIVSPNLPDRIRHWMVIILIIGFILDILTTGSKGIRILFRNTRRLPIDPSKH